MNKKDYERGKRERAEREEKARSDSKDRRETIKVRWDLDRRQLRTAANLQERSNRLTTLKRQKFEKLLACVKEQTGEGDLYEDVKELVELAGLQDQEIEYLTAFRDELERVKKHYPAEFQNLSTASFWAHIQPMLKKMHVEEKPKQTYELKRQYYKVSDRGEIENGFGNLAQVSSPPFNLALGAYEQLLGISTCPVLDDIFTEGGVSMLKLQRLFGLNRSRFPRVLPSFKKGRERLYDYRVLTKIMDALLSEEAPSPGAIKQGRPVRRWLNDPAIRTRVLEGIEARAKAIEAPKRVADAFERVIRRHLPDSAKK